MEINNIVRLIQPVIQGQITDTQYNKDGRCLQHLVQWTDADNNTHTRWFDEAELAIVEIEEGAI